MSPTSVHHFRHLWSLQRWKTAVQGYLTLQSTICTPVCTNPPMILNPRRKYNAKAKEMSLTQINHVLKTNEYSLKPNGFDSNILPSNSPCEDRWSGATCLQSRGMLFIECLMASFSERLFYYIAVSLLPLKTLTEIEEAVESERPVLPVLQWHKHPNDYVSTDAGKLYFNSPRTYWQEMIDLHEDDDSDIQTALRNAFKRLDNDISLEAQVDFGVPFAHFTPLRVALSGYLHVANLGDSKAVLGVQGDDGRWSALTVTNDHNAHNPDEMQRVLSEHPASERKTVVKHDRLLGLLIPFRAFGDMKFKWSGELLNRIYEARPELLIGNDLMIKNVFVILICQLFSSHSS
uniref:Si:ch211-15p9.2 n=1 Tax=Sinocyclocheilus rhinocerous TaxID=307959 RepID=A0A673HBK6_9TELE